MNQELPPKWILIVTALFALLGLVVSFSLCFSPQLVLDQVDLNARGVNYLIYMWAARQFALGFIFGLAAWKKSVPMLTISYVFFLVMNIGDVLIGFLQKDNALVIGATVMCLVASTMIFVLSQRK